MVKAIFQAKNHTQNDFYLPDLEPVSVNIEEKGFLSKNTTVADTGEGKGCSF
jgi:hypothetical protein